MKHKSISTLIQKLIFICLFTTGALYLSSCDDDDDNNNVITPDQSIAAALKTDPDYSILSEAIDKAGLYSMLNDPDNSYTLLAPSNRAFIEAGITDLDNFTSEELASLVKYHLIPSVKYYSDFQEGSVETENGPIYFSIGGNRYYINGESEFIQINYVATNGVVHTIDDVLTPPDRTLTQIVDNASDLTMLEAAIEKTDLTAELNMDDAYTFFAPTNEAFEDLFDELNVSGLDEIPTEMLKNILLYHIVDGRMFTPDLSAGNQTTLEGDSFKIYYDYGTVLRDNNDQTDDALIINDNSLATNGVLHRINSVLVPNNF